MADVPVGAVPAPETPAVPVKPTNPVVVAREQRAAKLAQVNAGLSKMNDAAPFSAPRPAADMLPSEKAPEAPVEKKVEAAVPIEPVVEEPKVEEPKVEADEKTAKALAAIDKQAKKFREEQAVAKRAFEQEMAQQRADFAVQQREWQTKLDEYKHAAAQAKRDPIGYLRKLGIESEDEWEAVGRGAFPFTKAGKADPRSQQVVTASAKERELLDRVEAAEKRSQEALERLEATTKHQEAAQVVEKWKAEATKAIQPNTLVARLHAKSPERAAEKLLHIAVELERANDNETPSHAEVVAELERREREELELRGVDVDALLKPTTAPTPRAPSKTLDPEAPKGGTRPINGNPSRAERLANISAGLKKLDAGV